MPTWGLSEQSGPADIGQQVVDVWGWLHVLCVHRRLEIRNEKQKHLGKQEVTHIGLHDV